jgi:tRNA(Ile)-lysidine synthase
MPETIEQKVLNFVSVNNLWTDGSKVLLAVSGGADSVALVEILANLKSSGKIGCHFHIAHINHLLRDEKSFDDEQYVKSLAKKHNLPATCLRIDVKTYAKEKKLSIETAARDLRLDALGKIAKQNNCAAIATAHHKNDNAETVIHRLLRGTGFKGLAGIRPKTILNDIAFIRPLLCLCKTEIEDYLCSRNIKWQTDLTNADCRFTRNRIRHRIIPYLQKQSKTDIADLLFKLSEKTLKLYDKIEEQAKSEFLETAQFINQSPLVQVEVIQNLLQTQNIGLQKFTKVHYKKIMKFIAQAEAGKILQLPSDAIIQKTQTGFFVSDSKKPPAVSKQVILPIPGKIHFADWLIETEIVSAKKISLSSIKNKNDNLVEYFDLNGIEMPLTARFRQKGDKFIPFGRKTLQKIGKFTAAENQVIIFQDNKQILWLAPIRRSSRAAITNQTNNFLKITIKDAHNLKLSAF